MTSPRQMLVTAVVCVLSGRQSAVLHDSDVLVMFWPRSEAGLSADTGHRSGKVSGWPSSLESFKRRLNEGSRRFYNHGVVVS